MESENEEKREPIINDIIYLSKWEWLRHGARAYLCDRKERAEDKYIRVFGGQKVLEFLIDGLFHFVM